MDGGEGGINDGKEGRDGQWLLVMVVAKRKATMHSKVCVSPGSAFSSQRRKGKQQCSCCCCCFATKRNSLRSLMSMPRF